MAEVCVCAAKITRGAESVNLLTDPRLFNFVIMALYSINAGRWAISGKWADMCYWLSALAITATVTWGYKH